MAHLKKYHFLHSELQMMGPFILFHFDDNNNFVFSSLPSSQMFRSGKSLSHPHSKQRNLKHL